MLTRPAYLDDDDDEHSYAGGAADQHPGTDHDLYGRHHTELNDPTSAGILKTVQDQEEEFEQFTRELEAERRHLVTHRVKPPPSNYDPPHFVIPTSTNIARPVNSNNSNSTVSGNMTASMTAPYAGHDAWNGTHSYNVESESFGPHLNSSNLLDSCLDELDERHKMSAHSNLSYSGSPGDPYHGRMMNGGTNVAYDHHGDQSPNSSHLSLQSGGSNRPGDYYNPSKLVHDPYIGSRGSLTSYPQEQPRSDNYIPYSASPRNNNDTPTRGMGYPAQLNTADRLSPAIRDPPGYIDATQDNYEVGPGGDASYPMYQNNAYYPDNDPQQQYGVGIDEPPHYTHDSMTHTKYRDSPTLDERYRYDEDVDSPLPPVQNDGRHPDDRYNDSFHGLSQSNQYLGGPPQANDDYIDDRPQHQQYPVVIDDPYHRPPPPEHEMYRDSPPLTRPPDPPRRNKEHLFNDDDPYRSGSNLEISRGLPPPDPPHRSKEHLYNDNDPYRSGQNLDTSRGLPPVQNDPFANDPFQGKQQQLHSHSLQHVNDSYRQTPSPTAGIDRYDERPPDMYHDDPREQALPYTGYDGHPAGYDGPPAGYDGPPAGYDGALAGYDGAPAGYNGPPAGYDGYDDDPHRRLDELDLNADGGRVPPVYIEKFEPEKAQPQYGSNQQMDYSSDPNDTSRRWRNPDLQEVIEYLSHNDDDIKAQAAAYLQHLTFKDEDLKAKTRGMDGIPPLVQLLTNEFPEVHRNAAGALKNLSYGKANAENKRAIRNAGGMPLLARLLRKSHDPSTLELVSGVLWNLSSSEELKMQILADALVVVVQYVVIPHVGWTRSRPDDLRQPQEIEYTAVLRNATGILRNISSAQDLSRQKLRECEGLVDSLVHLVRSSIHQNDIDSKVVENCVCVLRNLSYRCQEIDDVHFHEKRAATLRKQKPQSASGETVGCFGAVKSGKKKKTPNANSRTEDTAITGHNYLTGHPRGAMLLWHPSIIPLYQALMENCSNTVTLEAAIGAIQNLAACDWMPSIEIRNTVRKEKVLPIIVELLNVESERVVCSAAIALRNLAIDAKNKELIGKYAMKPLIVKLPALSSRTHPTDETLCGVLLTIHEVIKNSADFADTVLNENGVARLKTITHSTDMYQRRTIKCAANVLLLMWQFEELHQNYRRHGLTQDDFLKITATPRLGSSTTPNTSAMSTPYSTMSRPMSTQGYDDTTLTPGRSLNKPSNGVHHVDGPPRMNVPAHFQGYSNPMLNREQGPPEPDSYHEESRHPEHVQMNDMGAYSIEANHHDYERRDRNKPPAGGVALFQPLDKAPTPPTHEPREPLYAQVNRGASKRRGEGERMMLDGGGDPADADSWV